MASLPFVASAQTPSQPSNPDRGSELVLERIPQKIGPPKMFQVVMLNDDFTPMEFVVLVLQEFFSMDRSRAERVMYQVHMDGKAVCGIYTRDVALTKVDRVLDAAQQSGHPLQCLCEPVE